MGWGRKDGEERACASGRAATLRVRSCPVLQAFKASLKREVKFKSDFQVWEE